MRHADNELAHAERAAALDDLLQCRDHRFGAVETKSLRPGEFHVAEFLKTFGFDQLVEDGALAFARERDLLVRAFNALLDPAFLRAVGNVQEFDAQRLAIGAAQDADDLAYGAEFETKHLVEENPAIEIGFAETVSARLELLLVLRHFEAERIELGVKMAARAIGADQHQRADRVAGGALDIGRRNVHAARLRLRLDFAADGFADFRPIAVERRDKLAVLGHRPIRPAPRRAARVLFDVARVVLQALEEPLPLGIDRLGVGLVTGVKVLDIIGVAAVEKRRNRESGIRVLARHGGSSSKPRTKGRKTAC